MPASDLDTLIYWSDAKDLSKYDRTRAGPSDEGLVIMWSIYSPLLFLFSFVITILFLAILTNPKVRRNPFNKYIMFLSFPDFVYSFLCAITCLASALNNGYTSWEMCQFQTFYLLFGASANTCLNGLLAWEVHKLLRSSQIRRKYYPPTDKQVYITSLSCYGIALIAAGLPLLGTAVEWLPEPGIQAGFLCMPAEETLAHTLFWWLVNVPLTFGIPYVYAAYVFYDVIFRSKLLPPKGKRRELTVYFFRIGAMFLFLWMPSFAVLFFFNGLLSPWVTWGFGLFSHTQGLVSALIAMMKKDVGDAVKEFVFGCCQSSTTGNSTGDAGNKLESSRVETTVSSTFVISPESSYQEAVDDLGLPIQGADFQYLDEMPSAPLDSEAREDGPNDHDSSNSAEDV